MVRCQPDSPIGQRHPVDSTPPRFKPPAWISAPIVGHSLLLACTLGVIWGAVGFDLRDEYQRTVEDATERTANLAQTFEETIGRSADVMDNAVRFAREYYLRDRDHFNISAWMRDKATLRKFAVQLAIADASGAVVMSSVHGAPPANLTDREHFKIHADAPANAPDRLFISKPVMGRLSNHLSIEFSRRMSNPDGSFAGVAIASFDPLVLDNFQHASQVAGGFTMLIGFDGVIRAAEPDAARIGEVFSQTDIIEEFSGSGVVAPPNHTVIILNDTAMMGYRKVPGYDLFVAAGYPHHVVFASFETERRNTLFVGASLSLIVLFIGEVTMRHRRRLAHFQRALTTTMDNVSQGILMIDSRRRMPVVNRRVAELLDLPLALVSPDADFDAIIAWQRANGEFGPNPTGDEPGSDPRLAVYERTRANGTVLEIRTTVLPDGSVVRTFTDITQQKRAERELATARDAAEAGARARTEFLAVMSHEIRTPMNGIVGACGLLNDMPLGAEQREYVNTIRDCGNHLLLLIQDILDLSRLDAGRLDLEEIAFDPGALIQNTIEMLGGQARAKGLFLSCHTEGEVSGQVVGDPSRLRQILLNLIGNGLKFTDAGGVAVASRLLAIDEHRATLVVAVTDSGIGIDLDSRQKLFSAFTQVDSSISRRFGGAGLGLAISKHLVSLMVGSIDVDSVPGQGSTFRFSIQLARAASVPVAGPARVAAPHRDRHLKILLAEDNPTNRYIAIRMLTRMGYAVDAVEDGAQAVRAAAGADYDAIIMDMMMPEMDGITATRMIRAGAPPRCHTPIIGLTANAFASDRAACAAAGMNGFVTKPVTMERLRAAVEAALSQRVTPREQRGGSNVVLVATSS
jgi:signal transduction histidine kinase/ActR/RegA family two-component response regulator